MLDEKILKELKQYVNFHLNIQVYSIIENDKQIEHIEGIKISEIDEFLKNNRTPSFHELMFDIIDKKGLTDPEVYKKAGIDRKHFSKIRSNPKYRPSKNTTIALALALELNHEDMITLLNSAGYSLSDCDTFDLIIQFCLEKKIYDLYIVNQALDNFSLKPLSTNF
jgi:hypothetical protein